MNTIFNEPAAHNVSHIEAEAIHHARYREDRGFVRLTLKLSGLQGDKPVEGEFDIYGPAEVAERFRAVAEAINKAFDVQPDEEEAA
jgi:hypothetical protein